MRLAAAAAEVCCGANCEAICLPLQQRVCPQVVEEILVAATSIGPAWECVQHSHCRYPDLLHSTGIQVEHER